MSKVLVVGNGFDIALGLYSRYSDFVNARSNIEHAFWPFRDKPSGEFAKESLYAHFYDYFNSHKDEIGKILWIDIEGELLKYAKSKINKTINPKLAKKDERDFNQLKMMLQAFIGRLMSLGRNEANQHFIRLMNAIKTNGGFDKAYSFNYTDLHYELINFLGFAENQLPSVTNIHGKPDKEDYFKIVLGINEDLKIPQEYHFLFKSKQILTSDLAYDMAHADEIMFYGLSLGEIDFPYFESFFHYINSQPIVSPKKHITIFTFGKDSVMAIEKSIHNMNMKIHDLKEKSYFNIIDMENVWLPGHDETAFNYILKRLSPDSTHESK